MQTLVQAMSFLQGLKSGHYIKVPPRATFLGVCWGFYIQSVAADWFPVAQLIATVLVVFVRIRTKQWIFANVKDICQPTQSSFLTCPRSQVLFTSSIIWYVVWGGFHMQLLTRRDGAQGFDQSKSSIWRWDNIPSMGVHFHHRSIPPFAVLALATALPEIMGTLGEHAYNPPQHVFYPTCNGDQLLVVVPRRIRFPAPHLGVQFYMLEQVQLCNGCGDGCRDWSFDIFVIFLS